MKRVLERQDSLVILQITRDGIGRIDALAEREGYEQESLRVSLLCGMAHELLKAGMCRGELFRRMEIALAGRCNCDVETKGSA